MKKIIFLLLFPFTLTSCFSQKKTNQILLTNTNIPETDHEYFEVEDKTINRKDIFNINVTNYYVYIYSITCNHCNEIKNWIIGVALERNDIFFVKGSNNDVIKSDVSSSIGANKIEDIVILGYPSLLQINNGIIIKNVAGKTMIQNLLI